MLNTKEEIKELMEQYLHVEGNDIIQKDVAGALVAALFNYHQMEITEGLSAN